MDYYTEERRYEKIDSEIFESSFDASVSVGKTIADLIKEKQSAKEKCVLGLATGSTPISVYEELVRLHKEEGLSFRNVVTFNLDEYFPMEPTAIQSYVRFMKVHLFDHIDIDPANIHIPDGTIDPNDIPAFCREYEEKIKSHGGLDLQLLGIGRTGHIGFNEPGSSDRSRTRAITLDHITRVDAASDFFGEDWVPRNAITMGVGSILDAKQIYLLAFGEGKAPITREAMEGSVSEQVPATYLQYHKNCKIILDEAAAAKLTRFQTPWLVGSCEWDDKLTRKAVIWLCMHLNKPILKLTDREYNDNGMSDLVFKHGTAYTLNIRLFNEMQHTISGWPGGKPNADDTNRPERSSPAQKRAIIFSPHPDDDVISMGGTFQRLVDQGHEVHVGYQTSGNIAVFDDDVLRYADFFKELDHKYGISTTESSKFYSEISKKIETKDPGELDSEEVRIVKGLIRKTEARSACRFVGIPESHAHFMNMPFYETGLVKKEPIGKEDIGITVDLLRKIEPHQIYAAGDLSDPHGTHRVCLEAIRQAIEVVKNDDWFKDCWVWLYRGAWQEWDIDEIEMAVPMSPDQLRSKRKAIFKHQSQKDSALFPGSDDREFWQRSEDRNHKTAEMYDLLGLAEYEAMEAFVRWHF